MHTQFEQAIDQLVVQLQNEGILDEQFHQLMQLQDETNPVSKFMFSSPCDPNHRMAHAYTHACPCMPQDFVAEVIQLYFEDSVGKIDKMGHIASSTSGAPDFNELDQLVHQVGAAGGRWAGRRGWGVLKMDHTSWWGRISTGQGSWASQG